MIALSYGLTGRECQVAMQCIQGHATREIAQALAMSPHTVQDHLKSIFDKTGVRSRGELVGQIFLDHYATRWEAPSGSTPPGVLALSIDTSSTAKWSEVPRPNQHVGPKIWDAADSISG